MADGMTGRLAELAAGLADLVLPAACAGCGAHRVRLRYETCGGCVAALERLRPFSAVPVPVPAAMPRCVALGEYAGVLRQSLLSYKEKGRHRLAGPLGALLAVPVAEAAVVARGHVPVLVVPVPSTARAARQRHGDHVARLAAHCVRRLRVAGWQAAVVQPLRVLPRPDSALLDSAGRVAAAQASLRVRRTRAARVRRVVLERQAMVLVVDDIVTTGATLTAVTQRLAQADVPVAAAAVLAATALRKARPAAPTVVSPDDARWANHRESVLRTKDD